MLLLLLKIQVIKCISVNAHLFLHTLNKTTRSDTKISTSVKRKKKNKTHTQKKYFAFALEQSAHDSGENKKESIERKKKRNQYNGYIK